MIEPGDIIRFTSSEVPIDIQATVVEIDGDDLDVLSTFLVPFQHSGKFRLSEIEGLEILMRAIDALPKTTGFHQGDLVKCEIGAGKVIAGFDGIVVARMSDGQLLTGGRSFFTNESEGERLSDAVERWMQSDED